MTIMGRSTEVSTTSRVAFALACDVLLDDPGALFSDFHTLEEQRERRFSMDLGVGIGTGASVRQDVSVRLGADRRVDDGLVLPLEWCATSHVRLLPTFKGELEVSPVGAGTLVRLTGDYRVPFGVVGKFGDGVVGRRLARHSLQDLVERLASRLESEVDRRLDAAKWRPTPPPVALNEQGHHPEIYVG